jgi:DNA adenine methylase
MKPMKDKAPTRPILRYYGGKWRIAPRILAHFPPHRIYVEPYGGAGSVLLRKPPAAIEVYNDIDADIVNVFRVLRSADGARQLRQACSLTPWSRRELLSPIDRSDPVEWARQVVFRAFASRRGAPITAPPAFRHTLQRPLSAEWQRWGGQVQAFTDRLSLVTIEERDALQVMQDYDTPATLHYVDPPYMTDTRTNKRIYKQEMDLWEHSRLLEACKELRGMVVISGYQTGLYRDMLEGWHTARISAQVDSCRAATECLWMNFEPDKK